MKLNQVKKQGIVSGISALLIILFLYAGLSKLLEYSVFQMQLAKSPMLTPYSEMLAILLPIGEIILALALFYDKYRLVSFYASFFIMSLFTIYLIYVLNFSYYIPCSCGGILGKLSWGSHIIFNVFFILISFLGILLQTTQSKANLSPINNQSHEI